MADDMRNKTEDYWRKKLTPVQFHVLREKGTEIPGSGTLLHNNKNGEYKCAACGTILFKSDAKYDSKTPGLIGWPSFVRPANFENIELRDDNHLFMNRTEVICKKCGSHLGHVFNDSSSPTNQHFCINSCALNFSSENKFK
jgi:peptide-methionine (R)-S-oxide reductase